MPPVIADVFPEVEENDAAGASDIQKFYAHKKIFITGGTGFLGKVIIEKLLRTTDVELIYLLIRDKRGCDGEKRFNDTFKDPLFDLLEQQEPKYRQRLAYVMGDASLPDLGLCKLDREKLTANVQIVIHGAATVKFTERLHLALAINVAGTMAMVKLCKEMTKLESFVHVSSAFANCNNLHIEEKPYKLKLSGEDACHLMECMDADTLDYVTPKLIGEFPNTYTFTKALAESVIFKHASDLPVAIFRPGIVIPTYKEPLTGWIDNLNGPTSILTGISTGILRVLYFRPEGIANIVPVDLCGNALIAAASQVPQIRSIEPPIYNFVPENDNQVHWNAYRVYTERHGPKIPLSKQVVWYPFVVLTSTKQLYTIMTFLLHIVPGFLMDAMLTAAGKQPRLLKIYKKIHLGCDLLDYFIERDWTFGTANVRSLWDGLSDRDKELYMFDMKAVDWETQFVYTLQGMRKYIMKEDPASVPEALKLHEKLKTIHYITLAIIYASLLFTVYYLFHALF